MDRNSENKKGARVDLIVLLLIYSILYIAGDLLTTGWLVYNDPYGILHESNPIGRALYLSGGLLGLAAGKIAAFAPLCITALVFDERFRGLTWFREVVETTILGLITYSMIITLNNIFAIIFIASSLGASDIVRLYPIVKVIVLLLSTGINILILRIQGYRDWVRVFEVIMGTLVVAGPLALYQPLLDFLKEQLWLLALYVISVITILGVFFYLFEEFRKKDNSHSKVVVGRIHENT